MGGPGLRRMHAAVHISQDRSGGHLRHLPHDVCGQVEPQFDGGAGSICDCRFLRIVRSHKVTNSILIFRCADQAAALEVTMSFFKGCERS